MHASELHALIAKSRRQIGLLHRLDLLLSATSFALMWRWVRYWAVGLLGLGISLATALGIASAAARMFGIPAAADNPTPTAWVLLASSLAIGTLLGGWVAALTAQAYKVVWIIPPVIIVLILLVLPAPPLWAFFAILLGLLAPVGLLESVFRGRLPSHPGRPLEAPNRVRL